jgi:hypothetical protein
VAKLVGHVLLGAAGLAALRALAGNLLAAAREAASLLGGLGGRTNPPRRRRKE